MSKFQLTANETTMFKGSWVVLNEETITPRISNAAMNCYASPSLSLNPSPNCRDELKCKEIIAVNGQVREALPDTRQCQTHVGTRNLTPANILSLMASLNLQTHH